MTLRSILLASMLTLAPASVIAQGMPAADEIALPRARPSRPPAAERRDPPPSASKAPARPPRAAARRARRTRARASRRAVRAPAARDDDLDASSADDEGDGSDEYDDDAEAERLVQEGIEYEVQQQVEWEERQRRERQDADRAEREPPPRARAEDEERAASRSSGQAVDDEDILHPPRRPRRRAQAVLEREAEPRHARAPQDDLIRLDVGLSATTREQIVDRADGSTIRFGLTPFASAYGSVVATPFARLQSGPTGLGVALSYDRAIRMEAMTDEQVLDASADHFAALLLYRFQLPGRVRIEPRVGYDLVRFLLAPNDTLPSIVYESIALGGNVQIPILRDAQTGADKIRVRFGGSLYFPIGLGDAAAVWGQSGSASGFSFEGGLEGTVSGTFGYFALLRYASYTATFHTPTVATGGETESQDGVTTGLCGGSVRF